MGFLVDMPLSPVLAAWLRDQGHDAAHAAELGLERASDADILIRAKREKWTIVTADLDYPRLLALSGDSEPSLILFRGGNWSDVEVLARIAAILSSMPAADIVGSVLVVDQHRVRRRRLPIRD